MATLIFTARDFIEDLLKSIDLASVGKQRPEPPRSTTGTELPSGSGYAHNLLTNGIHTTKEIQVMDTVSTFTSGVQPTSDAALVLQPARDGHDLALSASHVLISQSLRRFISCITGLATTACVHPFSHSRIHSELVSATSEYTMYAGGLVLHHCDVSDKIRAGSDSLPNDPTSIAALSRIAFQDQDSPLQISLSPSTYPAGREQL